MDGYINDKIVHQVREVLEDSEKRERMVRENYEIAARHYSYAVLRKRLSFVISNFFGIQL
jgi:hypothetical protein